MERQPLPTGSDETAIIPQLGEDHFDVVMRGYDRRQVDERVSLLRNRAQELERRLEAAQADAADAWHEVESFRQAATHAPPTAQQLGDRITGLLRLADEEAAARRSAAKADADRLTKEAEERTKQAITEAEARARKLLAEAEEKSRRSDTEARRRIDSLERHHSDLVQRMTRMRDVLVELLGQERAASEAAKPAPSTAPAGQPASSSGATEESVRIVQAQPSAPPRPGAPPVPNAPAKPVQPGGEGPVRRETSDHPDPAGAPRAPSPVAQGQAGQRRT
jgi:cell division septum initiation protein DivIVA